MVVRQFIVEVRQLLRLCMRKHRLSGRFENGREHRRDIAHSGRRCCENSLERLVKVPRAADLRHARSTGTHHEGHDHAEDDATPGGGRDLKGRRTLHACVGLLCVF